MATAFETLKNKVQATGSGETKPVSAFDSLKQRQSLIDSSSVQPSQSKSDIKGGIVGELLTGSTQRFGKTIGESLAAPGNADKYSESLQNHTKIQNDLLKAIKTKKGLGQDTSRLQNALEDHVDSTPKLRDFTGDVIDKTAGQVVGEGIGTGLEALSGGLLSSGVKTVASKGVPLLTKLNQLGKVGAAYGAISSGAGTMAEGGNTGDVLKSTAIGGATGYGLGAGLGAVGAGVSKLISPRVLNPDKVNKITGGILQGEAKDIPRGQKVLKMIDTSKIKTYDEGVKALDSHVENLSAKQDSHLSRDKTLRKLKDLSFSTDVEGKAVKHNYVTDAIDQLDDFYTKTNNTVEKARLSQLKSKATKEGLTVKEINDLARSHGQNLNAYNASGELASGLSKQGAENTRAGLKSTVRSYGGKVSEKIDKDISDSIKIRGLFKDTAEKVNKLQQRIQERSLGAKAGYLLGRVINTIGLGSPKGIVEAMIPRGQGFKVMNAVDLEKSLEKNLKFLREVSDKTIPENTLIQRIESFINKDPFGKSSQYSPLQKLSKQPIKNSTKIIPKIIPKTLPKLHKKSSILVEEASKYKTAEDFVDSLKLTEQSSPNTSVSSLAKNIGVENFGGKGVFQLPQVKTNLSAVESWETKIKNGERPIVYTGGTSPRLVDGNNRLQAYKNLGFKEVPVVQESQLIDIWNKANKNKGATTLGTLLGGSTLGGIGVGLSKLSSEPTELYKAPSEPNDKITKKPRPVVRPVLIPGAVPIETLRKEVALRESRGTDNPYMATSTKPNKDGSVDLGIYQVNPSLLDTYYEKLMGEKITPDEFLNSPDKQEEFFTRIYNHAVKNLNVRSLKSFLTLWHGNGFSDISTKAIEKLQENPEMQDYLNRK